MERYKNKVKYWMTFNEINNQKNYEYPLFGYTCSGVIFNNEKHPERMYVSGGTSRISGKCHGSKRRT